MAKKGTPIEPTLTQKPTPMRAIIKRTEEREHPRYGKRFIVQVLMVDACEILPTDDVVTFGRFHNFTFYGDNHEVYQVFGGGTSACAVQPVRSDELELRRELV